MITREVNTEIPTKYYKYQCREHMSSNELWYAFSLTDLHNKDKKRDLLLNKSILTLDYVKRRVNIIQIESKADQYLVQNLTWSAVYLRSTLSNNLLYKVLILVPPTATGPEVFVTIMTKFLSNSYDALEETINHMNSLKLNSYPGENVTHFCA